MNYTAIAKSAKVAIKDAGREVVFYTPASTGGYSDTGEPLADVARAESIGVGVKLGYRIAEIDGQAIQAGDARVLYSGVTPLVGMNVDLDGQTWQVVQSNPLNPAGIVLLYTVQIRR